MTNQPEFSISDLAREFGVTTRTIRFYEEKGLVAPRRLGHKRVYSATDRTRLRLILRGKRLGFSLEESREIIDMYDAASGNDRQLQTLINRIRTSRASLNQQMSDIKAVLADLAEVEHRCFELLGRKPDSRPSEQSGK